MTWTRTSSGRAIMGVVAVYAMMVAIVIGVRTAGYHFSAPARLGIAIALGVPALWAVLSYWRSIDELAREAQKWAWFWGGSCGLGVGLLAVSAKPLNLVSVLPAGSTPFEYLAFGGLAVLICQVAGFTVAWIYWWMARR
jgi:hypothetical protein